MTPPKTPTDPPDAGSTGLLAAEARKAVLTRLIGERTREFRATVRSREDFEVVLARSTPPVSRRLHLAVQFLLVMAAGVYFLAGQWPSRSLPAELIAVALPAGYALFWAFLATTSGEELERITVDEFGRLASARSGRSMQTRGNVLRVVIPATVAAFSGLIALDLAHDILFRPTPNCDLRAVLETDLCVKLPGLLGGGGKSGFTLGDYRGIVQNLRILALLFSLVFLLPSIVFLRRMLTGRRVFDVRPARPPRRNPEDGVSLRVEMGSATAAAGVCLAILLIGTAIVPNPPGGSQSITAGAQPGNTGDCTYWCGNGSAQVTVNGTTTTVSPGGCFEEGDGMVDARFGAWRTHDGDWLLVAVWRNFGTPYGSGYAGGKIFVLGSDAKGLVTSDNRGNVSATDSLSDLRTIGITFSCG